MVKKRKKLVEVDSNDGVVQLGNTFFPNPELVPTGSTLFNLALSDNPYGGWRRGSICNLVGDRDTGKTFLALNMFAEACLCDTLDDYDFIYDEPEQKLDLPIGALFGKATGERLKTKPSSSLIEDLYVNIEKKFNKKDANPFLYVLDSFDSLSDVEEMAKTELKRDYPAKPRLASELFRKVKGRIRETQSLLLVVSQVRQNIGVMFGDKYTRAGGKALGHYATQEAWLAVLKKIKKKERQNGVHVKVRVKKNHYNGKLRDVEFDIVQNYGVDDIGSMIDWMCIEGFWKKTAKKIDTGVDFQALIDLETERLQASKPKPKEYTGVEKEKLAKYIDENNLENDLIQIVATCWKEIEDSLVMDRKNRYE